MYGYFCSGFIDCMLKGVLDYANIFYPNKYEKKKKMILKYLQ